MATTVEQLNVKIEVDASGAVKNINLTGKGVKDLSNKFRNAEGETKRFGLSMKSLGASIVVANQAIDLASRIYAKLSRAMDLTVGSALELGKSVAEITTLLDDSSGMTQKLTDDILNLQARYGGSQSDIARSYYNAISSGAVDASNAVELLDSAQKLAIGGLTSLENATTGMVSILNGFGMSAENVTRVSDALFIGMKKGVTTIGALSSELGMVSDIAKTAGLSLEEMVSAVSAMTTAGISTSIAVTQLRAAIVGLNKPSEELQSIYNKLNISNIETTISTKGFVETLKMIVKQTDGTNQALFQLFGRQEAVAAILKLTGDTIGPRYIATLKEMRKAALAQGAATEEAYQKIAKTSRQVFDVMKGQIAAALTRIGDAIITAAIPAIEKLASMFEDLAEKAKDLSLVITSFKWKELGEKVLYVAGTFVTLKAAMAALALMQGVRGVQLLTITFATLAPNIIKAAAAMAVFTKSLLAFAKIAAIIIAVASAIELVIDNLGRLDKLGKVIIQGLKLLFEKLKLTVKELSIALTDMIIGIIEKMNPLISKFTGFVLNIEKARESQDKLKKEVADATFAILDQEDAWKELSKGVDLSGIGFLMEETKKGAEDTAYWLGKNDKLTEEIANNLKMEESNQAKVTELAQKQLEALQGIREENRRYELDLLNFGATQEKQILNNLTYDKQSLEIKKRKLAVEKLLTGEMGRQMTEELKKQQQYIEKKAKLELEALKEKKAEEEAKKITPEMKVAMAIGIAFGDGAKLIFQSIEDGWNYFAGFVDDFVSGGKTVFGQFVDDMFNMFGDVVDDFKGITSASRQGMAEQTTDILPGLDLSEITGELSKAGEGFGKALAGAYTKLSGDISAYIAAAQAIVDILPSTIDNLTKLFDSIAEWPDRILNGVTKLMDAAVKVFTDFVPKFFKNLPKIFEKIFVQGIPKMIVALTEVLSNIDKIIIEGFIEKMPDLIEEATYRIISSLPIIIDRFVVFLVRQLPTIAAKLTELILIDFPIRMAEGLIKALGDAWKYLIEGKKPDWFDNEIAQKSAKKFTSIVTAGTSEQLFRLLDEEAALKRGQSANEIQSAMSEGSKKTVSLLEKWWSELEKTWKQLWNFGVELWRKFWSALEKTWRELWNGIVEAWRAIWEFVGVIWEGIKNVIKGIIEGAVMILTQLAEGIQHFIEEFGKILSAVGEKIGEFVEWLLEGVGKFFDGVVKFGSAVVDFIKGLVSGLIEGAKSIGQGILDTFKQVIGLVGSAITSAFSSVGKIFTDFIDSVSSVFAVIKDGIAKVFEPIGDLFKSFGNSIASFTGSVTNLADFGMKLKEAFDNFTSGVGQIGQKIFDGFKSAFENVGNFFSDIGGKIWGGLKSGLDGLENFFKDLFEKLNPTSLFNKVFGIDPKETERGRGGTVENILKINLPFIQFAKGGSVPGNASVPGDSELNDKILALLSPGEAIIPRSIMSDPVLSKIIKDILAGELNVPKFAFGGKIGGTFGKIAEGDISGAVSDLKNVSIDQTKKEISNAIDMAESVIDMLNPEKMWQKVRDFVFGDMVWKLFESNKFHDGGIIRNKIPKYANGTDDVLIKAQSGEFMLNRTGRAMIGDNVLNAANNGRFANGDYNQSINITINTSKPFDESLVKTRIIPEIKKEMKRNSVDGRFLLDQRGIRA